MATYVLMTKLSTAGMHQHRRPAGQEWKHKVEKAVPGLRWISHYALLGPYDFMDVYEAPDDAAAMRVSLVSRELGAACAESWPALPYERFLPLAEECEQV
jgi:uncharacterized protein with GYD domain